MAIKTKLNQRVAQELARQRLVYAKARDSAFMFRTPLPDMPDIELIEAKMKLRWSKNAKSK